MLIRIWLNPVSMLESLNWLKKTMMIWRNCWKWLWSTDVRGSLFAMGQGGARHNFLSRSGQGVKICGARRDSCKTFPGRSVHPSCEQYYALRWWGGGGRREWWWLWGWGWWWWWGGGFCVTQTGRWQPVRQYWQLFVELGKTKRVWRNNDEDDYFDVKRSVILREPTPQRRPGVRRKWEK